MKNKAPLVVSFDFGEGSRFRMEIPLSEIPDIQSPTFPNPSKEDSAWAAAAAAMNICMGCSEFDDFGWEQGELRAQMRFHNTRDPLQMTSISRGFQAAFCSMTGTKPKAQFNTNERYYSWTAEGLNFSDPEMAPSDLGVIVTGKPGGLKGVSVIKGEEFIKLRDMEGGASLLVTDVREGWLLACLGALARGGSKDIFPNDSYSSSGYMAKFQLDMSDSDAIEGLRKYLDLAGVAFMEIMEGEVEPGSKNDLLVRREVFEEAQALSNDTSSGHQKQKLRI